MSDPRPIHFPSREIRTDPHESEPRASYEEPSPLLDEEDDFHNRLSRNRRESSGNAGGSFWRTSGESPNFSSAQLKKSSSEVSPRTSEGRATRSTGLLAEALHAQTSDSVNSRHSSDRTSGSGGGGTTMRRADSDRISTGGSQRDSKKNLKKQRKADRQLKADYLEGRVEGAHIEDLTAQPVLPPPPGGFGDMNHSTSLDRSSSDQSTGSLLYGKTPSSGALLGKSSSLIFPTGVETNAEGDSEADQAKRRKINLLLDQCEANRFPFRKRLLLEKLGITAADIPLQFLVGTPLGNALHKLSLVGNRLGSVPPKLVQSLPNLKHLDLSQCELHQLPQNWNLPQLRKLNLSHNRLRDFPDESIVEGLPELTDLNMYGNKVAAIVVPRDPSVLSKLENLNLGYNDLAYLPDELDQLKSLKSMKLMNNFLEKVPMRVCEMDLKTIDVSFNPVIQPPLETCERGIFSMRRYYHCLRLEAQSKHKAMEDASKKRGQKKKDHKDAPKKESYKGFLQKFSIAKSPSNISSKHSDAVAQSRQAAVSAPTIGSTIPSKVLVPTAAKSLVRDMSDDSRKLSTGTTTSDEVGAVARGVEDEMPDMGVTVNDTLKVIFVGMAMVGKTSMIKRLIEGRDAVIPTHVERTVGVDIYSWDPKKDSRFEHIDSRIELDKELAATCGDVDVKFSCFDFAGQHVYHATHELFFSARALYVLVWDMGAANRTTYKRKPSVADESGAFKLSYDSESESEKETDDFADEEETRRADRSLERDIDEKVQFWVDCIQSSAPGAAILPVATKNDYFTSELGDAEARRRCNILKSRLLKHEASRMEGLRRRLQVFVDQNRPNDPAAQRLRKLQNMRPRLIFGDGDECMVRTSGTQYTGFEKLTEKIIDISTGRDKLNSRYAVFRGHVGAQIPRMFLEVREVVRMLRDKFKVVEWGYFLNQLKERGLTNDDYISEALHFLTNIGELSYFGGVTSNPRRDNSGGLNRAIVHDSASPAQLGTTANTNDDRSIGSGWEDLDDDDMDDDHAVLSMEETSITAPSTEDGSLTTVEDYMTSGLSQFVFLNPRWLVAAIACILRHDLDNEIKETRRLLTPGTLPRPVMDRKQSFEDAQMNCPVITAEDACLLWQAKKITKKAAERAQQYSNNMTMSPFEFLQLLLVRFGVFVPIDAGIQRALLGGKEYADIIDGVDPDSMVVAVEKKPVPEVHIERSSEAALKAKFFFLPSLLGPGEPSEAWTYKNTDSWKTTLCHSVLFPDGVPPGLMERLTANVLSAVYAVCNQSETYSTGYVANDVATYEGRLAIREVLCWRTAFFLRLGTILPAGKEGEQRESVVEIFGTLADRESRLCVGSDYMGVGMRRLIICGRGPEGDGGRKIWKGGYLLACKCVKRAMEGYGGLEFEEHGFCPECLAKRSINEASSWEVAAIRTAVKNGESRIRCQHGHRVDVRCVAGPVDNMLKHKNQDPDPDPDPVVPVRNLLGAVVVVGLWDGRTRKVVRVGSGFVVDRKRGLIVTASHTLINIWGDRNYPFGENYYGLRQGKVVIGVIPKNSDTDSSHGRDEAVFRYFAKIVAKDPGMDSGECHIDACVLRITTRLEKDVGADGEGCGDQPEILLLGNEQALKNEKLQGLKLCDNVELEEQVRILGYNQGGEGLLGPGESLNRFVDFARGYVCKKFASGEQERTAKSSLRDRFKPREEIAVICQTIGGHSGGPCVNQQGQVIGILSRADPAESQRCYISPTSEWKALVKQARNTM